ncbi:MAG TPA: DUF134 domain-containing protein [Candidatus Bathyarchaeia archaeon]|nr:DUF134 domain-containing protein [Candidatus Bathyarchaeia archaeon]
MPGRRRCRCVGFQPHFLYFEPRSSPRRGEGDEPSGSDTDESILKVEELESIRLKDQLRLSQEKAAERMGVSQPTFHRILSEAHRKIAEAFVEGKAIRIEGGNYMITKEAAHVPPPKVPCCWRGGRCGRGRML